MMREQVQSSRHHRRVVRRWIISIIPVVILFLAAVVGYLVTAQAPLRQAENQSTAIAKKYTHLKSKSDFYWTNLNGTYYTVAGNNQQNQAVYVVVPKKGGNVTVLQQKQGLTHQQVIAQVKSQYHPSKILGAGITTQTKKPAWIVNYKNSAGKLCYVTIQISNGKVLASILNI